MSQPDFIMDMDVYSMYPENITFKVMKNRKSESGDWDWHFWHHTEKKSHFDEELFTI